MAPKDSLARLRKALLDRAPSCPVASGTGGLTTPNRSPRSLVVSRTIRTARSRSSGGYRRWVECVLCSAMTP